MEVPPENLRLVAGTSRASVRETLDLPTPIGLAGILADTNHPARPGPVPARAARWGFAWAEADMHSRRWYPQGVSTSSDRGEDAAGDSDVVCISWYDRGTRRDRGKGTRVTFVDLADRERPRYRHVLLVDPVVDGDGNPSLRPVRVHAGGIVWHGPYLYVAGTRRGLGVFRVEDILAAPTAGYEYVLPLSFWYAARTGDGADPLRYSFVSLERTAEPAHLVVGEYGVRGRSTRLGRFELDPQTSLLRADDEYGCRPVSLHPGGVEHMQGATAVDGTYYVTASAGRFRHGDLWVGEPGALRRLPRVLPVGPEDIAYRRSTDELWSVSEYPGQRFVFAMGRAALQP